MSTESLDLGRLKEPFRPWEVEWRVGRAGKKNGDVWARVLAYITSRAIMDRLDEVCGPDGWQTAFREGDDHLQAGIGIRVGDEWVWKWDGTGRLDASGGLSGTDAGKGDFSNALKRAAVQWGVGRYLYDLDEGWAHVHPKGEHYGRLPKDKGGDSFRWDPPDLPSWALPEDAKEGVDRKTGEIRGTNGDAPDLDNSSKANAAKEATLKKISKALNAIEEKDEDKYANAYKHYENNLDTILGSETEAQKFLNRCRATLEAIKAEESAKEKVPA